MVRRNKLSLSNNIKCQKTISSYFAETARPELTKAANGQTSATTSCNTPKAATASTKVHNGSCTSAKRPSNDLDAELPLVQSLKKAKVDEPDSNSNSPDFIPATPEDNKKKHAQLPKLKSKRAISFAHLQNDQNIHNNPKESKGGALNKQFEGTNALLRERPNSVSTVIQPTIKNCDKPTKYSTEQDPLLAEILGDISLIDSSLSASECTDSKLLKASRVDNHKDIGPVLMGSRKQVPPNFKLESKIHKTIHKTTPAIDKKEDGRKLSVLASTSKPMKESTFQNSNVVLKDSTAAKLSPNKAKNFQVTNKNCEVKTRNIFLDSVDGNMLSLPSNRFFVKRVNHKKKPVEQEDDSKTPDAKPQAYLSGGSGLLEKILHSDAMKNAHNIVENNPTLTALKEKLIENKPPLGLSLNRDPVFNTNCRKVSMLPKKNIVEESSDEKVLRESHEKSSADMSAQKGKEKIPEEKSCSSAENMLDSKFCISVPKESSAGFVELIENKVSDSKNSHHSTNSPDKKPATERKPGDSFQDFDMKCFDDDWTLSQFQPEKKHKATVSYEETLDLTSAVHCKVLTVEVVKPFLESITWIECVKTGRTASCTVRAPWASLNVESEDIVCVEAVLAENTCLTRWMVDGTHGMLVIYPNTLISGTAVVGSLFCVRRSVLSNSYKGFDGSNDCMAIGTLVHEILQTVLKKNIRKLKDIEKQAESMLSDPNTIRLCYDADMSLVHVRRELSLFLPSIESFISKYVSIEEPSKKGNWLGAPANVSQRKKQHGDFKNGAQEWSGSIIGIEDIEENLWSPMLGIKGKIDVTVKVQENKGEKKILPLELKTGRASHSAEHRGQVMLYSMMMSRLGSPVQSGLLLYLRESSIREVKLSHQEERDLLMLRNRLACNLELQSKVDVEDIENVPTLPEPINLEKACSKCPYLTVCSVHLKREKYELRDNHPIKSLSIESTKHLTTAHTDYFFYWVQLIRLETQEQRKSIHQKNVWSLTPEKREKLGQALVNLRIKGTVTEDAGKFSHNFVRNHDVSVVGSQSLPDDFRKCCLSVGDYIVVSTNTRIAVDTGFVLSIDSSSICLALNRNLRKRYANDVFHLDNYESNYATASNLTNLSGLLDDTETAKRVREVVIDRVPPTFGNEVKKDVMEQLTPILANLNNAQREAAMAVLKSDRYALIKGLPGTGKTATMVALVCLLVKLGQSVLITSHTHNAVDNLLLRLKQKGVNFLRLGPATRIHPELQKNSEGFVTRDCRSPEDLAIALEAYQVVGVTCLGMNHPLFFRGRVFDICLVDESTQVLQSTVLRPLLNAKRFVLVGDPDQLPPVVRSPLAKQLGLGESLFARLDTGDATKSLDLNYRMNQTITDLANNLTYKGTLKCGNSKVANSVLELPNLQEVSKILPPSSWLNQALLPSLPASVLFLDSCGARIETPEEWEEAVSSEYGSKIEIKLVNFYEVKVVTTILRALVQAGVQQNEVGIIAPYRAQVTLIRKVLEHSNEFSKIEVNSVDQFQGRDKQVILYSCTRSDSCSRLPKDYEILNDHRRLTVAVTRAKCKLILIGDQSTLKSYAPFAELFSYLSPHQKINLPPQL